MSSPFYAKGDPGAPVDLVTQVDRTMTFWVGGTSVGTVDVPPFNPIIVHGSNPDVPRIEGISGTIVWVGDVEPNNALDLDIWADVSGAGADIVTDTLNSFNVGAPFSQQLVATGDEPIAWAVTPGFTIPSWLTLSTAGNLYGTPDTASSFDLSVDASNGFGPVSTMSYGVTIGGAIAPSITTVVLDPMFEGSSWSQQLESTGSIPITYALKPGDTKPSWMTIDSGGLLHGSPVLGSYGSFSIRATNSAGSDDQLFAGGSVTGIAPTITTASLGTLYAGIAPAVSSIGYAGSGGTTFAVVTTSLPGGYGTTLPAGLTLTSAGAITGSPSTAGAYAAFRVRATNAYGSDDQDYAAGTVLQSTPSITETSFNTMTVGQAFSQQLTFTGGAGPSPLAWSAISGLPAGSPAFACSSSGLVTGTPTVAVSTPATAVIRATNPTTAVADNQNITYTVNPVSAAWTAAGTTTAAALTSTSLTIDGPTVPAGSGNVVVVFVEHYTGGAAPTFTATYGGAAMTPAGQLLHFSGGTTMGQAVFYKTGVSAGSPQSIVVSSGGTATSMRAGSHSFKNVVTVGTLEVSALGTGASASKTLASSASTADVVAVGFGLYGGNRNDVLITPTGWTIPSGNHVVGATGSFTQAHATGYQPGPASSVASTFSVPSGTPPGYNWGIAALKLSST